MRLRRLVEWLRDATRDPPKDFRIPRSNVLHADDPWGEIIDEMWFELKTPYEPDPRLAELTPGQRALYALRWTVWEVSNGGFHQYFWNSTGYLAPEAIEGAELLGAQRYAEVIRHAAAIFPDEATLRDIDRRQEILDGDGDDGPLTKRLAELDEAFYRLLDDEPEHNIQKYVDRYVAGHPQEFFIDDAS